MRKSVLCGVLLLLFGKMVSAQQTLSLQECRDLAVKNNKELRIAEEKIRMADYEKKAALTKYFPQISANGAYMWNQKDLNLLDMGQLSSSLASSLGGLAQLPVVQQTVGAINDLQHLVNALHGLVPQRVGLVGYGVQGSDELADEPAEYDDGVDVEQFGHQDSPLCLLREQQGECELEGYRRDKVENVVEHLPVGDVVVPFYGCPDCYLPYHGDEQPAAQEICQVCDNHNRTGYGDAHLGVHLEDVCGVLFYHVVKFFCKGAASPCPGRQECHAKLIKENEEPAGYRPFFTENQAGSALFFLYWDGMMPNFL